MTKMEKILSEQRRCAELLMAGHPEEKGVFSPFAGIGSEGYVSLRQDRKFVGVELKESYWKQGCLNLAIAEREAKPMELFA